MQRKSIVRSFFKKFRVTCTARSESRVHSSNTVLQNSTACVGMTGFAYFTRSTDTQGEGEEWGREAILALWKVPSVGCLVVVVVVVVGTYLNTWPLSLWLSPHIDIYGTLLFFFFKGFAMHAIIIFLNYLSKLLNLTLNFESLSSRFLNKSCDNCHKGLWSGLILFPSKWSTCYLTRRLTHAQPHTHSLSLSLSLCLCLSCPRSIRSMLQRDQGPVTYSLCLGLTDIVRHLKRIEVYGRNRIGPIGCVCNTYSLFVDACGLALRTSVVGVFVWSPHVCCESADRVILLVEKVVRRRFTDFATFIFVFCQRLPLLFFFFFSSSCSLPSSC